MISTSTAYSQILRDRFFWTTAICLVLNTLSSAALAQTTGVTVIGPISGNAYASGTAYAVSNDGAIAVGSIQNAAGQLEAFRWTPSGAVGLGMIGPGLIQQSHAYGMSTDGSVIVGYGLHGAGVTASAFRWTQAGGMVNLGALPGASSPTSYAFGVSADGAIVVGSSAAANGRDRAFVWTQAGGMQAIGDVPSSRSAANAITRDGAFIVGNNNVNRAGISSGTQHAFIYDRLAQSTVYLAPLTANRAASARAVSDDGTVVAGQAAIDSQTTHAVRWQGTAAPVDLGTLGGTLAHTNFSTASGISGDGSIVVGSSFNASNLHEGFRWTQATGMRGMTQLLTDAGVTMTGQRIYNVVGVSQNGQFYAGERVTIGLAGDGAPEPVVIRYVDGTTGGGTGGTGTGGTGTGTGGTGTGGTGTGGTGTGGTGTGGTGTGTGGTGTGGTGGTIGGVTTFSSVAQSMYRVGQARRTAAIQQTGFASAMMGANLATTGRSGIGAYGGFGSISGGLTGRLAFDNGFALLGGISGMTERYKGVRVAPSFAFGGAAQYVAPVGFGGIRPYLEGGAWHLPDADYKFRRLYANGAGTALGVGKTSGQQTYVYGRVGAVIGSHEATEWTLAGEIGRMTTRIGAYAEGASPTNPFDATFARSTDTMTVGKVRLAVTHRFTPVVDGTLWVAGAKAFDQNIGAVAAVTGFGAVRPAVSRAQWVEYGARLGAKVTSNLRVDAFANGVAAPNSHKVHVGAGLNYQF